ncbi:MAG: cytidylyltransferase family protein [Desulfurococcales archaeon]|nr:cytidylyltransferase family protein [Desulfurococcales archaeon]MCE4605421.1 cytidylyltransferase family protein [Desulfurococcales archaeon]
MDPGDAESRAELYIRGVREALEKLRSRLDELGPGLDRLIDAAERYAGDAKYYLDIGDPLTALAAASYAEGLIDALKYLGVLEPEWGRPPEKPIVFVGGTFDIIHPGHVGLLRFASRYGRVIVTIARDSTVKRIKGRHPLLSEKDRLQIVSSIRYVYKARLGHEGDPLKSVEDVKPDVIVLGPDQAFNEEWLAEEAERRTGKRPLVVRYPGKHVFSGGLRSTSDIIKKACSSSLCTTIARS